MTEDLKLEGNQLNVAVTVFYSTSLENLLVRVIVALAGDIVCE